MDRNLGATSTTPGDVTALGLHYQWGRKDPFVGTASITSYVPVATTTDTWSYTKDLNDYTIEYAIANPTVKINYHYSNYDWLYTGSDECDNTRWQSQKTIYDPCPQGYRVTEGTERNRLDGVWPKAFDTTHPSLTADDVNKGFIIGAPYCSDEAWYPAPGYWGDLGSDTFYTWIPILSGLCLEISRLPLVARNDSWMLVARNDSWVLIVRNDKGMLRKRFRSTLLYGLRSR